MGSADRPERWYALNNGILLSEGTDEETGKPTFFQLQTSRPVTPDDLRRHDEQTVRHLETFASRWSLVLGVSFRLLLVLLVVVPVGLLLGQLDATEAVGGWMFWLGLPLAVLAFLLMKVGGWRLESGIRRIQQDAGLVPGMIDEIEHPRGLQLIETHGVTFTTERDLSAS